MMKRVFLFDFDGTIIDTIPLIIRCFQFISQKYKLPEFSRKRFIEEDVGAKTLKANIEILFPKKGEEEIQRIIAEYSAFQKAPENLKLLKLFPGVKSSLLELKKQGHQIGIVTSRTSPSLLQYSKLLGVHDMMDTIVSPEMTKKHKPDPQPLLKALELLKGKVENAVYVGDMPNDIKAGINACMETVFVKYSVYSHEKLVNVDGVKPTFFIEEFSDILKLSK